MAFKKILLSSKLVGKSTEVLTIATIISIISIAKVTRIVSKTTRTFYRQMQSNTNTQDTSRKTTLLPHQENVNVTPNSQTFTTTLIPGTTDEPEDKKQSYETSSNELFLQQQIVLLQKELTELRETSEARENRLLDLMEKKLFGRSFVLKKFIKTLLK
ncbi:MAG: hypothetical protein QF470_03430 [Methylococcales bacterium]|jgi:hypothetical protein|nr:hypothetical protein [Methylococcales bacterium]